MSLRWASSTGDREPHIQVAQAVALIKCQHLDQRNAIGCGEPAQESASDGSSRSNATINLRHQASPEPDAGLA